MRVVVVGAGVVGAATALALAEQGHSVDVLEQAGAPASRASHANAGLISPGHCFSWAEPGAVRAAVGSVFGASQDLGVCQPWTPSLWRWGALFAREATPPRWLENSAAALALSAYSRDVLFDATAVDPQAYGARREGIVYLYGDHHGPGENESRLLRAAGEPFQLLDGAALAQREPTLASSTIRFTGGVFCPRDGTGDAARFAQAAFARAVTLGARVHFSRAVTHLLHRAGRVTGVATVQETYPADAVVVAAGLASRELLAGLGYRLPIHPVSGYSLTYSDVPRLHPRVGAVSIAHKVAWASFGERLRFTGFADVGTPSPRRQRQRFRALEDFATAVCPPLAQARPERWVGQRPMTPDNLPFLGASRHEGLFLNCGHGAMGWTMACGSARVMADLIGGRGPGLDLAPYRWDRFTAFGRRPLRRRPLVPAG
jgi:D-amino-acid dehydrogenase